MSPLRLSAALALSCALALLPFGLAAQANTQTVGSQFGNLRVTTLATGLQNPWGMAFLPGGNVLVTERPGRLRVVTPQGGVSTPLTGVPAVFAQGQGGLLDIALDPDFASNRQVFLSFAEAGPNNTAGTASRSPQHQQHRTGKRERDLSRYAQGQHSRALRFAAGLRTRPSALHHVRR